MRREKLAKVKVLKSCFLFTKKWSLSYQSMVWCVCVTLTLGTLSCFHPARPDFIWFPPTWLIALFALYRLTRHNLVFFRNTERRWRGAGVACRVDRSFNEIFLNIFLSTLFILFVHSFSCFSIKVLVHLKYIINPNYYWRLFL